MGEAALDRVGNPPGRPARMGDALGWLHERERSVLIAAIGLQAVVLLTMIVLRALPLLFGDTVLIRVFPVDPRDLFRGDYVVLGYEFGRVPAAGIDGLPREAAGDRSRDWEGRTVYVSLTPEPDGVHWRAGMVGIHRPTGGRYLRGRIAGDNRLEFGIEAYYVQEGKGREYEKAVRDSRLSAEIALTSNGQAALRGLRVE
jgi:uncharacterized membrane-anchored protein